MAEVKYGMVVDLRKCYGCHACSVACKSENGVPLGVFRTWVKQVEKGKYPEVRRYFLPRLCNHCDEAICVKVCPVQATYKREDGPDQLRQVHRMRVLHCCLPLSGQVHRSGAQGGR